MADIIIRAGHARPAIYEKVEALGSHRGDLILVQVPGINPEEADELKRFLEEMLVDRSILVTDRDIRSLVAYSRDVRNQLRHKLDEADRKDHG